jgi:O-antigen ligase
LEKNPSVIKYSIYILCSIALILSTGSRKGLIVGFALLIPSLFTIAKNNRKFLISCVPVGIFILLVSIINFDTLVKSITDLNVFSRLEGFAEYFKGGTGDSSTKWRYHFIQEALRVFFNNVYLGIGIDNFKETTGTTYAHNNYVEILADLGLTGLTIFYSIYYFIFKHIYKYKAYLIDYFMIISLLFMDLALVSYYMRFYWISVVYILVITEKDLMQLPKQLRDK